MGRYMRLKFLAVKSASLLSVLSYIFTTPASADVSLNDLAVIRNTSEDICLKPDQRGTLTSGEAEVKANIGLSNLLSHLAKIDGDVSLKGSRTQFENVIQRDLEKNNESYRLCVQAMIVTLFNHVDFHSPQKSPNFNQVPAASNVTPKVVIQPHPSDQYTEIQKHGCPISERSAEGWRVKNLHPFHINTWHVIVSSLGDGSTPEQAALKTSKFQTKFPLFDFDAIPTEATQDGRNYQWAIVMASGLDRGQAEHVARLARACGVARDAYTYRQAW